MAIIQDLQKNVDTKFKTLNLLQKDTLRIQNVTENKLIKQKSYSRNG